MAQQPDRGRQLGAYLAAWQPTGWCWAQAHCGAFAAGWVQYATGRDALDGLRHITTLPGWVRAVRGDMAALVSRQLGGLQPQPPALARTGDVLLLPGTLAGGALGVANGRHALVLDEQGGVQFVPLQRAVHAWPLAEVAA